MDRNTREVIFHQQPIELTGSQCALYDLVEL